jgi:hypothetical protein
MTALSIGRAWDEAKAALQANRKLIVPVAMGMVLLPAVIVSMVEPQVPAGEQPPPGLWMLIALAMLVVMLIGELAIVLLVNGWRGSVGEAIGKASRRAPALILAALVYVLPFAVLFSIMLAASGVTPGGQFDAANMRPTLLLPMLLLFVALLVVTIRLLPLVALVACEKVGPFAALKRTWALTQGHFWRLLGFLLMLAVAFLIVALTVGAVIGTLVTFTLGRPEPWSISLVLVALAGGLVQAGFVMVYIAMLARIYAQLGAGQATVPEVKRED